MQKFVLLTLGVVALSQLTLGDYLSPITEENRKLNSEYLIQDLIKPF